MALVGRQGIGVFPASYIDFYYSNYLDRGSKEYNLMESKDKILKSQYETLLKRAQNTAKPSKNVKDAEQLVNALMGEEGARELEQALMPQRMTDESPKIQTTAGASLSFLQARKQELFGGQVVNGRLNEYQNLLDAIKELLNFIDVTFFKGVGADNLYESIKKSLLDGKTPDQTSALQKEILQAVTKNKGKWQSVLMNTDNSINDYVKKLASIVYLLEQKGKALARSWGKVEKKGRDPLHVLDSIAGSIEGLYSNAKADLYEMSLTVFDVTSNFEVFDKLLIGLDAIGKSEAIRFEKEDSEIRAFVSNAKAQYSQVVNQGKGDVLVTLGSYHTKIQFGVSAKYYEYDGNGKANPIKLQDETPFLTHIIESGLIKNNGFMNYMLNVAGGHSDSEISDSQLESKWKDIVNYVALANFLNNLAGYGLQGGDTVFFLATPRGFHSVGYIINEIRKVPDPNKYVKISAFKGSSLSRSAFSIFNNWEGTPEEKNINEALVRSGKAKVDITAAFYSAKTRATLSWS